MSRPEISVVMPFAGSAAEAAGAVRSLRALDVRPGDQLILVDNSATGIDVGGPHGDREPALTVIPALEERSPAYARNVGAAAARNDWILFLDADTHPRDGLLGALWGDGIPDDVGALAGEIVPAPEPAGLVGRYGSARNFLSQRAHREHPYRARAAAANLLVRRVAFEQLGGFYEGVRAAEDTDFAWRLQAAGWKLALRDEAVVEHRYRTSLRELRRQWRGYAAGRAWLGRRYDGFVPEPALRRAPGHLRVGLRARDSGAAPGGAHVGSGQPVPPADRRRFLMLDALLSLEEVAGLLLSNHPPRDTRPRSSANVVLVAERFPDRGDPLVELAASLERARVEALSRPQTPDLAAVRRLAIDYLEDDGRLGRAAATVWLVLRHPWRSLVDVARRAADDPPLHVLAPAARRIADDGAARLHALGVGRSRAVARRLAFLTGRPLD